MISKVKTIFKIGLLNTWRVFQYRLIIKTPLNPFRKLHVKLDKGVFFFPADHWSKQDPVNAHFNYSHTEKKSSFTYFGWFNPEIPEVPNWHKNPFNNTKLENSNRPWWQIPDFDPHLGDIKTVWEASRFDWVLTLAQQTAQGNLAALDKLNYWLSDWCTHNPAYYGVNWKCGQEASIRVMHLAFAALILQQHQQASPALQTLINAHLQRIAPTIQYAIAQENNHGTSEAAALFIGGTWLVLLGDNRGQQWVKMGRKWLENRAARLIDSDGSFSQYSVNYHRVMLDTYSMAEHWRKCLNLPAFSDRLYKQLTAATYWLHQMTQTTEGDAPNLGTNDGARLLPLSDTDYRDFRPSVQLAMALFCKQRAYSEEGEWNTPLRWLKISLPHTVALPPTSKHYPDGGYSVLRQGDVFVLLRFPHFRFRPSQADALHVDLWLNGENLLRDGGTYSYNAGEDITRYFGGTASHNTIQFDDRDQMPRFSRFLFGEWLQAREVVPPHTEDSIIQAAAAYRDYQSAYHHRTVSISTTSLRVSDKIFGFKHKAILRWRLQSGEWLLNGTSISNGKHSLRITSSVPITRITLTEGWESRYYLQQTTLPVLEIELQQAGEITSEYYFNI